MVISDRLHGHRIHTYDIHWEQEVPKEPWECHRYVANAADFVADIDNTAVSLSSAVELSNCGDVEPVHEFLPDACPKSSTYKYFDLVLFIIFRWWGGKQVAANFSKVYRAL